MWMNKHLSWYLMSPVCKYVIVDRPDVPFGPNDDDDDDDDEEELSIATSNNSKAAPGQ